MNNESENLPINTWGQVGNGGVFISYRGSEPRRVMPRGCQVIGVGFKTGQDEPWYNYGNKTFIGKKAESLKLAKQWAEQKFGIKRWKRNGMGDYIDADKNYLPLKREAEAKQRRNQTK